MSTDEISLRPLSLRPGGKSANPFAGFGKGAGFAVKKQVRIVSTESWPLVFAEMQYCPSL